MPNQPVPQVWQTGIVDTSHLSRDGRGHVCRVVVACLAFSRGQRVDLRGCPCPDRLSLWRVVERVTSRLSDQFVDSPCVRSLKPKAPRVFVAGSFAHHRRLSMQLVNSRLW